MKRADCSAPGDPYQTNKQIFFKSLIFILNGDKLYRLSQRRKQGREKREKEDYRHETGRLY